MTNKDTQINNTNAEENLNKVPTQNQTLQHTKQMDSNCSFPDLVQALSRVEHGGLNLVIGFRMTSEKNIPCGPCLFDDVTKDAGKWCTNCEEGICEDCENVHRKGKTTRNHKVISIEDYHKIEHVSISLTCEQHDENLGWFCKIHDEVLCVVCVSSKHKACFDVIPISVNSANSRQSSALSDLEKKIDGTLLNLKQCILNRESAKKEIEKQELVIKTMVLETRTKINGHLDKLEEKLLQKLRSTSNRCKSAYMKTLQKLKSTEEMITNFREQTQHIKQFSSDIQVFLGTRQVNRQIEREMKTIKSEIGTTRSYELKVVMHSLIETLLNEFKEFGQIKVSESPTRQNFGDQKIDQAQIGINDQTPRSISNIKLQIMKTIQMKREGYISITGCIILPNGHSLMANCTKDNYLIEYSDTGDYVRDIKVSDKPFDIALIDHYRIVVTYGDASFLEIRNTKTNNIETKISLQKKCKGVSYEDGRLYVVQENDILVLDLSGKQLKRLKTASQGLVYIKTTGGKMFFTDCALCKVHCWDLNGKEIWQLQSDNFDYAKGVIVDDYNNVYVVGYKHNNLTIIQPDGKDSKTLLTESDGLNHPRAVDFDQATKTIIICNAEGQFALYKVV